MEGYPLGDAQAGAVGHPERGAVADAGDVVEEQRHFLLAENDGGVFGNAGAQQACGVEGRLQGYAIKELDGGEKLIHRLCRVPAFVGQVDLILADVFQVQMFRAGLIELGQTGDVMQIGSLGLGRQIAQLHVFDHAFS